MNEPDPVAEPDLPTDPPDGGLLGAPWFIPAVIVVVALLGGLAWVAFDKGDVKVTAAPVPIPTSTLPTTTTTTPPGGVVDTTPLTADVSAAIWPVAESSQRYDDPAAAALGFATGLVGFVAPVLGTFTPDDAVASAGTVEVRPTAEGPVTLVQVKQLGEDASWWVTAASTANIQVFEPATGDTIASPVRLTGTAMAFEGTVGVQVRADGIPEPLGTGVVTGRGDGVPGPYESALEFGPSPTAAGVLLYTTESAENGQVWEATALRVRFIPG